MKKLSEDLLSREFQSTSGAKPLRDYLAADKPTVFLAYPMDFTLVCTKQLCSYRDNWAKMSELPCAWYGVNQVAAEKHEDFKQKKNLPMDLLTDPNGDLLKALDLWGILKTRRGLAVVSPEGNILGSMHVFPLFYPDTDRVVDYVKSLI